MSAFLCKKSALFGKNSTFTESNSVRAVFEIFLALFSVFARQKVTINGNLSFRIQLPDCSKLAKNWKNHNGVAIYRLGVIFNFLDAVLFLLWRLVDGLNSNSIPSLLLDLWQFSFIRDWPENRKSEIPSSEFCPISGDWGELMISNLTQMSLMKCY